MLAYILAAAITACDVASYMRDSHDRIKQHDLERIVDVSFERKQVCVAIDASKNATQFNTMRADVTQDVQNFYAQYGVDITFVDAPLSPTHDQVTVRVCSDKEYWQQGYDPEAALGIAQMELRSVMMHDGISRYTEEGVHKNATSQDLRRELPIVLAHELGHLFMLYHSYLSVEDEIVDEYYGKRNLMTSVSRKEVLFEHTLQSEQVSLMHSYLGGGTAYRLLQHDSFGYLLHLHAKAVLLRKSLERLPCGDEKK